jgi:hypothetical protein
MEYADLLPCSQEPSMSSSRARPVKSTTCHPISIRYILISAHLRLGLPSGLFPSCFPTNYFFTYFSSPPCVLLFTLRKMLVFYVEELLALYQTPVWRTTSCRLSVTVYLIHSLLPFIYEGLLVHPQPEVAPCRGDKKPV